MKAHEPEQEEKVIEQDFESSQRAESCETKIQLGADDPINRAPNCDQIITGGSLSEEVQRENESADSRGKIKEQIEEEGCLEDVQMIAAVEVAMLDEKGLDSSSIKNLDETLSDDSKEKMTLDIAEDLNWEQEEPSVTKVPEDEKLADMTNLESVATHENSEYKIVHEPSSFHDKTDAKDVQVLDDSITFSSKENLVQVDPEESTELQVPCEEKVESMQQDPITVLEEIEEQQPGNSSEVFSKEKITLDIAEDLNRKQKNHPSQKCQNLASVASQENSDYKIVHEPSSFHDKTDTEDVQVLDDSITYSLKENLVQVDPEESTELQVLCGEKLESMQRDPITVVKEIEEQQPGNASEAVSKEKMTLDIAEDLIREQEESSVTKVSEDEKLANITSLAFVATEENSDNKIVHEPSSFHDKTDTEDVQVLDDSITFSSKENLVQVDPEESTELQVPCGEKVKSMQQDPITIMEEIEEQQPQNASEAVSETGVNYEGAT
ncbi:putative leucine-rich repeat-containing protein [Forsythia ovata]|uniref:Leucine-rich repeat-containing protein n=1 Tax=Forsythia ovata TaxID=205694 RepID=A0ABD1X9A5_9LAMI